MNNGNSTMQDSSSNGKCWRISPILHKCAILAFYAIFVVFFLALLLGDELQPVQTFYDCKAQTPRIFYTPQGVPYPPAPTHEIQFHSSPNVYVLYDCKDGTHAALGYTETDFMFSDAPKTTYHALYFSRLSKTFQGHPSARIVTLNPPHVYGRRVWVDYIFYGILFFLLACGFVMLVESFVLWVYTKWRQRELRQASLLEETLLPQQQSIVV